MKYINADLIKELMKRSIALQGNCEYTLWLQTVDNYVENLPSIDIDSRGHETMSDKVWCSKCRYLYRDFKYGLSCYRLMDDEPCKFEYRKAENSSEKPNNCEECEHWNDTEDGCADRHRCKTEPQSVTYNPTSVNNIWEKPTNPYVPNEQTEPTISKMEQVEDEPQTEPSFTATDFGKGTITRYTDEPQTDCDDCIYWDGCESRNRQTDCPWK